MDAAMKSLFSIHEAVKHKSSKIFLRRKDPFTKPLLLHKLIPF